jgi:hypothetical protein
MSETCLTNSWVPIMIDMVEKKQKQEAMDTVIHDSTLVQEMFRYELINETFGSALNAGLAYTDSSMILDNLLINAQFTAMHTVIYFYDTVDIDSNIFGLEFAMHMLPCVDHEEFVFFEFGVQRADLRALSSYLHRWNPPMARICCFTRNVSGNVRRIMMTSRFSLHELYATGYADCVTEEGTGSFEMRGIFELDNCGNTHAVANGISEMTLRMSLIEVVNYILVQ